MDEELKAMQQVLKIVGALESAAGQRVLAWVGSKLGERLTSSATPDIIRHGAHRHATIGETAAVDGGQI